MWKFKSKTKKITVYMEKLVTKEKLKTMEKGILTV